jgi:hypothetical protein
VPVSQLNSEHRVRKSLVNCALDLDDAVFVGHKLTYLYSFAASNTRKKTDLKEGFLRAETPRLNPRTFKEIMVVKIPMELGLSHI